MQSIDHLIDKLAMKISELETTSRTLYFSKKDQINAYSQLPLQSDTQKNVPLTY